jgi:5-hydroxyisourate hydrolase
MSWITTHVLDVSKGQPVAGMLVTLRSCGADNGVSVVIGQDKTDHDGRVRALPGKGQMLTPGVYLLQFDTSAVSSFFPEVSIQIQIADGEQGYHVPLLLSPFGYSTYRGR